MTDFFKILLTLSAGGALMALLLCLLRLLLGRRLQSGFYYFAWLMVLLRFILPVPGLAGRAPEVAQNASRDLRMEQSDSEIRPTRRSETIRGSEGGFTVEPAAVGGETFPNTETVPTVVETNETSAPSVDLTVLLKNPKLYMALWAVGAAASALWYISGYRGFIRALRRASLPPRESDRRVYKSLTSLGGPELRRSRGIASPLLTGVLRPIIVLPDREYTDDMLKSILKHELMHYRRGDVAFKWLAVAASALHWFNPLMSLVRRETDRACELSCDERILKTMEKDERQGYGETLLALAADRAVRRTALATTFSTDKRNLKERLEQIMNYKNKTGVTLALVLALLLLCGCGAVAGPAATDAPETTAAVEPAITDVALPAAGESAMPLGTSERTRVVVKSVDEFLAAIAPNIEIYLEKGEYLLSSAADYGTDGGEYYDWEDIGDGYELEIGDVNNLSIIADGLGENGKVETRLATEPRFANVVSFESCSNLLISGLEIGHTEAGVCSGGVIKLKNCVAAVVENCGLYGCGTLGIIASNCSGVAVNSTRIYSCSQGAAKVDSSRAVVFTGCEVYDCGGEGWGLFEFETSADCAVIDAEIHDNDATRLLFSEYSSGIHILGSKVENNSFESGLLYSVQYGATVDGCEFKGNRQKAWYSEGVYAYDGVQNISESATNMNGATLTEADLEAMTLERISWTPPEPAQSVMTGGEVTVSTVDELLAAIAPNTTITLSDGTYDLSSASDYGAYGSQYYSWQSVGDGTQLVISNVDELIIKGSDAAKVSIAAVPRYANVICFNDCADITISGVTVGHTQAPGSCMGGVLDFTECENVRINGCVLYGCGTWGITGFDCESFTIDNTEIKECSVGGVQLYDCKDFAFTSCSLHDLDGSDFSLSNCENITFDGKPAENGLR